MAEVTRLNTQLGRYVVRFLEADAGRAEPLSTDDERALADQVAELAEGLPPGIELLSSTEDECVVAVGFGTPQMLAVYIGLMDADFEVTGTPELLAEFGKLAVRYARAARTTP